MDKDGTVHKDTSKAWRKPEYPGGEKALFHYLSNNVAYPKDARNSSIEGTVYINFTVEKDGTTEQIVVKKSPHALLSAECIRVIRKMHRWKPGINANRIEAVSYTLPIGFKLD